MYQKVFEEGYAVVKKIQETQEDAIEAMRKTYCRCVYKQSHILCKWQWAFPYRK